MATEYALELEGISKSFGTVQALSNVTFNVKKGEIHGLIGQNGAGKSTLMKILSGIYPHGAFDGVIKLDGQVVQLEATLDAQLKGIAIVPQETMVADSLTVAENIVLPELARKSNSIYHKNKINNEIDAFLTNNEIPLEASKLVDELSLHEKQILMIARALYSKPRVLVLDEPTSSLTTEQIENLFKIVRKLKSAGFTTIFITHKLDEIMNLCDSVTVLRDGKTVTTLDKSEFNTTILIDSMIGRKIEDLYPTKVPVAANAKVILEVKNLLVSSMRVPGRPVINDVSFKLHQGEVLGIGGVVGSGRTELLRTLYGENLPIGGEILIEGKRIDLKNIPDAISMGIGYITEDRKGDGLLFNLTIRQNSTVSILDTLRKVRFFLKRGKQKELAHQSAVELSLKPRDIEAMVGALSGGNQQKVLLSKTLLTKPVILMLDEPTKGVDIGSKAEIYKIIHNLSALNVGIILVSSEFPELLATSHRIVAISNNKVAGEMTGDINKERELAELVMGNKK